MKKSRKIILLSLCCYAGILLTASVCVLASVRSLLQNYEASQPEYAVERQIARLKEAAKQGSLDRELTLSDSLRAAYDPKSPLFSEYIRLLTQGELTYRRGYTEREGCIGYDLLANGQKIATLIFQSENERTDLIVFQSADWTLTAVEPVIYSCNLTLAKELTVKMGDWTLSGTPAENGMLNYHMESLSKFSLTLWDEMGNSQSLENGSEPSVYTRSFTLPEELTVRLNREILPGTDAGDGNRNYTVCSLVPPRITVEDLYGHTATLESGDQLTLQTFTVTLPTDYTVTVGGRELSKEEFPVEYFEMYGYFRENYREFFPDGAMDGAPGTVRYSFLCLMTGDAGNDVVITAPDGSTVPFDAQKGSILITEQTKRTEPIPQTVLEGIDVQKFAETWSLFLHDDLSGSRHGFNTIAKYLIPGTGFYEDCYSWATGPDIGLISGHRLDRTPFTDETFDGYQAFGENCFVCDVRLNLHITLTKTGKKLVRPLNRTVCFVRLDLSDDGVDNPGWYALAFWDIIETEEGTEPE